jgi:transcriptional regulator with XRE-family HTH domain
VALALPQSKMDLNLKLIVETRKRNRLTQADLARAVGVAPSQMSRFETGKRRPHLDEARKIAKELNLSLSEIIVNGETEPAHIVVASLPLPEGRAVVEYPDTLSSKSREALKQWLELIASIAVSK